MQQLELPLICENDGTIEVSYENLFEYGRQVGRQGKYLPNEVGRIKPNPYSCGWERLLEGWELGRQELRQAEEAMKALASEDLVVEHHWWYRSSGSSMVGFSPGLGQPDGT